jgi:hypothetical protein
MRMMFSLAFNPSVGIEIIYATAAPLNDRLEVVKRDQRYAPNLNKNKNDIG